MMLKKIDVHLRFLELTQRSDERKSLNLTKSYGR